MFAGRRTTATVAFAMPRRRAMASPHAFGGELRFDIRRPGSNGFRQRLTSKCPDPGRSRQIDNVMASARRAATERERPKPAGSSTPARKLRATIGPIPGAVISSLPGSAAALHKRRQCGGGQAIEYVACG
jgi:hypothetical protein